MNTELSNKRLRETAWKFLLCQPPVGRQPNPALSSLPHRMCDGTIGPVSRAVVIRRDLYYAAGCPADLCELAACRDLFNASNLPEDTSDAVAVAKLAKAVPSEGRLQ